MNNLLLYNLYIFVEKGKISQILNLVYDMDRQSTKICNGMESSITSESSSKSGLKLADSFLLAATHA